MKMYTLTEQQLITFADEAYGYGYACSAYRCHPGQFVLERFLNGDMPDLTPGAVITNDFPTAHKDNP